MSDTTFGLPGETLGQARRSPMEMVCDILGVLSEGPTKPTHILYKANMSWKVLAAYLEFLQGRGLIEKEDQGGKRSTYKLTSKGMSILKVYDGLRLSLMGKAPANQGELLGLLSAPVTKAEERKAHPFVW